MPCRCRRPAACSTNLGAYGCGDGGPLPPHRVSQSIGDYFREHGIDGSAHRLRHWFATNVYRQAGDIRLTQELLGHSSPAVTAVYAAFDPARAGPTVAALGVEKVHPHSVESVDPCSRT